MKEIKYMVWITEEKENNVPLAATARNSGENKFHTR